MDKIELLLEKLQASLAARVIDDDAGAPEPPKCAACRGMGVIIINGKFTHCDAPNCAAAAANKQRRYRLMLERSGLPDKYAALTFESWESIPAGERVGKSLAAGAVWCWVNGYWFSLREAAAAVGRVLDDDTPKSWIVLQGGLGLGKTGLAAAAVNELITLGRSPLYIRLQDAISSIQRSYRADSDTDADTVINTIADADVLVIDEFNLHDETTDKKRIVESIVRSRHGKQLPTLFTTNAAPEELTKMWGPRTTDVMFESSHIIELTGPKLRKTAATVRSF